MRHRLSCSARRTPMRTSPTSWNGSQGRFALIDAPAVLDVNPLMPKSVSTHRSSCSCGRCSERPISARRGSFPLSPASIDPGHHFVERSTSRSEIVRCVSGVFVPERDACHHISIVGNTQMGTYELWIRGQGCLRRRGYSKILCRKDEVRQVGAGVDGTVRAETTVGRDDRHVWSAKKRKFSSV